MKLKIRTRKASMNNNTAPFYTALTNTLIEVTGIVGKAN